MIIPQVLAEFYHCSPEIQSEAALMQAAEAAASRVGATVVGRSSVTYQPHGLTVAVFLAESHIVLTTWPEYDLLLLDSLLCNPEMSGHDVADEIRQRLCPQGRHVLHTVDRFIAGHAPA
jgi:S-adenosylmethionine decarboxylase